VVTETLRGRLEYYPNDDPIGRALTQYGEWAEMEMSVLRALCGPGQAVVEVGANVGAHTLAFAQWVGPHGSVHAFEPRKPIFDLLQRNMAANGGGTVRLYQAGLAAVEGEMRTPAIDYGAHANVGVVTLKAKHSDEGELVRTLTLDGLDLERCDLLKIDAEGMGGEVLAGARGLIERLAPVVAIECNSVGEGVAAFQSLPSGYRVWLLRAAAFNPGNFRRNPDNVFGVAREMTLIFVPERLGAPVPESREGAELLPVANLDDLASAILATPRYGDATAFDRDPDRLREALADGERAHQATKSRLEAMDEALAVSERAHQETQARLEAEGEAASRRHDEETANLKAVHQQQVRGLEFRTASLLKQLGAVEVALIRFQDEEPAHRARALELEDLQCRLNEREFQLAALQNSTCWRVTAPLRGFKGLLGKGTR
jgi:FkbM family methyltransferase